MQNLGGLHFDVAIIGAGINGASAAQHLSAAGYRVLVVDQDDFANGASSRSSRLLHCGLRHLANGSSVYGLMMRPDRLLRSLGTVRADMVARDEIVRTIPERVKAMNFCLPIYRDDPYAPWHMDAAFAMLRMTSLGGVPLDYRRYRASRLDQVPVTPWLRDPDKLRSVAVFREYIFDWPERIALDALFDARRMGARVHNYMEVTALTRDDAKNHWRLSLQDVSQDSRAHEVTASVVLNLAGAWVDRVIGRTGENAPRKSNGIKGIHIALQLPPEFADWGIFTYNSLGEPLYCLPWRGIHYVGLTRTPHQGDASGVYATDPEIDWMLGETNRCLPKLGLTRADVLYSWAGVNPLTHDPEEPLGSREIKIHDLSADNLAGMFTLTGGPIMTHRRVANRLLDHVRSVLPPSAREQNIRYRPENSFGRGEGVGITAPYGQVSPEAIAHSAQHENPKTLADLMMRRLGVGWDVDQGQKLAAQIAGQAAPHLGWSQARTESEIRAYHDLLARDRRRPSQI